MISDRLFIACFILLSCCSSLRAQTSVPFYVEDFDSVVPPRLPAGWTTTSNKSPSGDFTTSTSASLSSPNAVVTTDAKVAQRLASPLIDFGSKLPAYIEFHERRTSSYNSGLLVEASVNNDTSFAILIGDTLKNTGASGYVTRTLPLPASLRDVSGVRFRWRVLGNGTGSTGTLRIDDVSVTVQKQRDLAISSLSVEPSVVRSGGDAAVRFGISNRAVGGTFSFSLRLYDDKNPDSAATADEMICEESFTRDFPAADSEAIVLTYSNIAPGAHRLIGILVFPGDEDSTNNSMTTSFLAGYSYHAIVLNEIMYAPSKGPEWVEGINITTDTISLAQWKMGDNTASRVVITSAQVKIPPRQFFIISRDSTIFSFFPVPRVPVVRSSFPALNNDGDAVVIVDPAGFTIDSVAYEPSWGGTGGCSLERIDTAGGSNSAANWGTSRNPAGATPGFVNSVTKKDFDASVERITLSTAAPMIKESFQVSAVVKNNGRKALHGISVSFNADWSDTQEPPQLFGNTRLTSLSPSDSTEVTRPMTVALQGEHRIFVSIDGKEDEDSTNNSAVLSFTAGIRPCSVVVNEIMYAPPGDMPEWIEFYNAGSETVDMNGWKISDSNVKTKSLVANAPFPVAPGEYLLVSADSTLSRYFALPSPVIVSSFSALNNSTPDAVVLFDNRGITMDSVWYKPSWGGINGRSLERVDCFASSVDSANWRSSAPTCGFENSVAKKDLDLEVNRITGSPTANGSRLSATIHNAGRKSVSSFVVEFFYDANCDSIASPGELLKSLQESSLAAGDSVVFFFEWSTGVKGKVPLVCRVELPGDQRAANNEKFGWTANSFLAQSVVINEIMYDPLPGQSEFIELFNRSRDTIDLRGWKMSDALSSSGSRNTFNFPDRSTAVPPGGYLVISADSTLAAQFPVFTSSLGSRILIANKDLSLNNSGDDVVLFDLTDTRIDSVRYSPSWNNPALKASTSGKSLERINPSFSGNDKRNWSTSVSPAGATPAERNSIYTVALPSSASLRLSPNPFSPDNDGFEDNLAIAYSLPSTTSMIRVRCFDLQGRLIRTLANTEAAASSGTILWDGLDDNRQRVRMGMYIILFEAFDAYGGSVRTMKDVAVVARRL